MISLDIPNHIEFAACLQVPFRERYVLIRSLEIVIRENEAALKHHCSLDYGDNTCDVCQFSGEI